MSPAIERKLLHYCIEVSILKRGVPELFVRCSETGADLVLVSNPVSRSDSGLDARAHACRHTAAVGDDRQAWPASSIESPDLRISPVPDNLLAVLTSRTVCLRTSRNGGSLFPYSTAFWFHPLCAGNMKRVFQQNYYKYTYYLVNITIDKN